MAAPRKTTNVVTMTTVLEMLAQGKSRNTILKRLENTGMSTQHARTLYNNAIREFAPDTNLLDDYKRALIQQNLDRLERIIEETISGDTQEKEVALQSIDILNKMVGVYTSGNNVTINKNQEGDEQIVISFQ